MHAVWTMDRSYHRANYDESSKKAMRRQMVGVLEKVLEQ